MIYNLRIAAKEDAIDRFLEVHGFRKSGKGWFNDGCYAYYNSSFLDEKLGHSVLVFDLPTTRKYTEVMELEKLSPSRTTNIEFKNLERVIKELTNHDLARNGAKLNERQNSRV